MILKTDKAAANDRIQNELCSMINFHAEILGHVRSITGESLQNTAMGAFIRCSYGGDGDMNDRLERVIDDVEHGINRYSNNRNDNSIHFNTYPFGNACDDVFPQLVVLYREKEGKGALKKAVAHMVSYCQKSITCPATIDERDIVFFTDIWKESMQSLLESQLANFYFAGKLCVHVILFTPYGLTSVPFFMERQWRGPKASLISNERDDAFFEVLHDLVQYPIEFSYSGYDGTMASTSRSYSYEIHIDSDGNGKIKNVNSGAVFPIPTDALVEFVYYIHSIRDKIKDIGGCFGCDCPTYYIKLYNTSIRGIAFIEDNDFSKLINAFKLLLRRSRKRFLKKKTNSRAHD